MKNIFLCLVITLCGLRIEAQVSSKAKPAPKDFNPTQSIAKLMIEALKKGDTAFFIQKLMPEQAGFDRLYKAIYIDNPEILKYINTVSARNTVMVKLTKSFKSVLAQGESAGIDWKSIQFKWSGETIQKKTASTGFTVPIQFLYNKKEYRVLLTFCNWLNEDPRIYVLGDIQWTGEVRP